jgi:hypothetical protein
MRCHLTAARLHLVARACTPPFSKFLRLGAQDGVHEGTWLSGLVSGLAGAPQALDVATAGGRLVLYVQNASVSCRSMRSCTALL